MNGNAIVQKLWNQCRVSAVPSIAAEDLEGLNDALPPLQIIAVRWCTILSGKHSQKKPPALLQRRRILEMLCNPFAVWILRLTPVE